MDEKIDWDAPANPPTHDFDAESVVEGVVRSFGSVLIEKKPRKYLHVDVGDGSLRTVWYTTVIAKRVVELDAKVGDYLGIRYVGMEMSKARGDEYRNFDVRCVPSNSVDA